MAPEREATASSDTGGPPKTFLAAVDCNRLPSDAEAELSVLAHVARPLHPVPDLDHIDGRWFYDQRHARIVDALRAGDVLGTDDERYVANAVQYAFPITTAVVDSFVDHHQRRSRLVALEAERMELLGVIR